MIKKYLSLFALLMAVQFASCSPAAEKPNLVFIIADDCTYLETGVCSGQARTPALDQIRDRVSQKPKSDVY